MTTTNPVPDRILDLIKKCLALSESSEPHEAALALERAQKLMQQYGVTAESAEVGAIKEEELRSIASASKLKGWELRLFDAIANAFGCALLFKRGIKPETVKKFGLRDEARYGRYIFLGPERDAKVALYAAQVLQRQLARSRQAYTATLPRWMSKGEKTREVDAYCTGWVIAATKKVQPLVRSAAQQAIIKRKVEEVATAEAPELNDKSHKSITRAMSQGYVDGQQAQLHRPMPEKGATERVALEEPRCKTCGAFRAAHEPGFGMHPFVS